MARMSFSNSTKLLSAVGSVWVNPSLVSAAQLSGTLHEVIESLSSSPQSALETLNQEIETLAETAFAKMSRELPDDARALFAQMVETVVMNADELVAFDLDIGATVEGMLSKMTAPEHQTQTMQALFRTIAEPALGKLLEDQAVTAELTLAFRQESLSRQSKLQESLDKLIQTQGPPLDVIQNYQIAKRDELEAIASRFGINNAYSKTDAELRDLLKGKAEELRDLQSRIGELAKRDQHFPEIMSQVKTAVEVGDFEKADDLWGSAETRQIEQILPEMAKLAGFRFQRGATKLLLGDIEAASRYFSEAADTLVPFSLVEAGALYDAAGRRFSMHVRRYGGNGLTEAIALYQSAMECYSKSNDPEGYANTQNNLGVARLELGNRTPGEASMSLLNAALEDHKAVLKVLNPRDHAVTWGAAQNNLANVLHDIGRRIGGKEGLLLVAEAAAAHSVALTVRTRADFPDHWAMTQNNLANCLSHLGKFFNNNKGIELLRKAETSFRAALEVRTRTDYPSDWGTTMSNLGDVLGILAHRIGGEPGNVLMSDAISTLEQSLSIRTKSDYPHAWADTQTKIGVVKSLNGRNADGVLAVQLQQEALIAFQNALTVKDRQGHQIAWAGIQGNMALAYEGLSVADAKNAKHHLTSAIAHSEAALEVLSLDSSMAASNQATVHLDRYRSQLKILDSSNA